MYSPFSSFYIIIEKEPNKAEMRRARTGCLESAKTKPFSVENRWRLKAAVRRQNATLPGAAFICAVIKGISWRAARLKNAEMRLTHTA